ncbi:unnamed protein product, partial [Cylicostephanus goldi]
TQEELDHIAYIQKLAEQDQLSLFPGSFVSDSAQDRTANNEEATESKSALEPTLPKSELTQEELDHIAYIQKLAEDSSLAHPAPQTSSLPAYTEAPPAEEATDAASVQLTQEELDHIAYIQRLAEESQIEFRPKAENLAEVSAITETGPAITDLEETLHRELSADEDSGETSVADDQSTSYASSPEGLTPGHSEQQDVDYIEDQPNNIYSNEDTMEIPAEMHDVDDDVISSPPPLENYSAEDRIEQPESLASDVKAADSAVLDTVQAPGVDLAAALSTTMEPLTNLAHQEDELTDAKSEQDSMSQMLPKRGYSISDDSRTIIDTIPQPKDLDIEVAKEEVDDNESATSGADEASPSASSPGAIMPEEPDDVTNVGIVVTETEEAQEPADEAPRSYQLTETLTESVAESQLAEGASEVAEPAEVSEVPEEETNAESETTSGADQMSPSDATSPVEDYQRYGEVASLPRSVDEREEFPVVTSRKTDTELASPEFEERHQPIASSLQNLWEPESSEDEPPRPSTLEAATSNQLIQEELDHIAYIQKLADEALHDQTKQQPISQNVTATADIKSPAKARVFEELIQEDNDDEEESEATSGADQPSLSGVSSLEEDDIPVR